MFLFLYFLFLCFCYVLGSHSAQGLLMPLHLKITPGNAWLTIWDIIDIEHGLAICKAHTLHTVLSGQFSSQHINCPQIYLNIFKVIIFFK